ncbi:pilus assembly PilX N-terminal domain-containing protein [Demequina sp.]|uniref:pilus assembly PilX N-terminal domain-containing protein n=1 Tax=Demequina sp. TaxID=2050685 RepID=UPI0025EA4C58|nr:pilus assembly PilX N-terminal domain-containing protein [Demequina sp.]
MFPMRLQARFRSDAGMALVVVLGIILVGAVIVTSLAFAAFYNSNRTSATRIEARALQSADAGIDMVQSVLEGLAYDELDQACGSKMTNLSINSDTVVVATQFTVVNSGVTSDVECPGSGDFTLKMVATSTATTPAALSTDGAIVRTVEATFLPTPPTVDLDKAIFSESDLDLNSNTNLLPSGAKNPDGSDDKDAHVYSNGTVLCASKVSAGGSIYATRGDIILKTNCDVENSVWASGRIDMSASNTYVDGDVYAYSSAANAFTLANTGQVTGSVLTNGTITSAGNVGLSLFANGGINLNGTIGGSAYSVGNLAFNKGVATRDAYSESGNITGTGTVKGNAKYAGTIDAKVTVTGTKTKGGASIPSTPNPAQDFPAYVGYVGGGKSIQAPPREQMPVLNLYTPGDVDINNWIASGFTPEYYDGTCSATEVANAITSGTWVTAGRLMIFQGCSSQAVYDVKTLNMQGDLALVSDSGWTTAGGTLNFNGSNPDPANFDNLFFIVPADSFDPDAADWVSAGTGTQTTPVCLNAPVGNILIDPQLHLSDLNILAYTPCTFDWKAALASSSDPWTGQVYAGNVEIHNSFDLKMSKVSVPSLVDTTASLSDPAGMQLAARFDVHGS